MSVTDEILGLYQKRGSDAYFGESVSMLEHGLQAAYFARTAAAPPLLVVASLLHDVGHLSRHVTLGQVGRALSAARDRASAVTVPSERARRFVRPAARLSRAVAGACNELVRT